MVHKSYLSASLAGFFLAVLTGCVPAATEPAADASVSQRGHAFLPAELEVARGARVAIANDEDRAIHHVFVESAAMRFDSGDQPPGTRSILTFEEAGRHTVLCGIHPRMRLEILVR